MTACRWCGRHLKTKASRRRGYGPVCYRKYVQRKGKPDRQLRLPLTYD